MGYKRTRSKSNVSGVEEKTKCEIPEENEPIVNKLSSETLRSAVNALLKDAKGFQKERSKRLTGVDNSNDAFIYKELTVFLQITLVTPPLKDKLRPTAIPLKHSLARVDDAVILFVRDPQRLVKDYLERYGNGGVTRVLGVEKLRKRYGTYEGRRELLSQFDRFLVDARVAPMMQRLLGKAFVDGKHMPLSVDMRHDVVATIRRALDSTAFCPRRGTCCSIRVARVDFPAEHVVENICTVLEKVVPRLECGWDSIQSINVKTTRSPALPVYFTLPKVIEMPAKISKQKRNKGSRKNQNLGPRKSLSKRREAGNSGEEASTKKILLRSSGKHVEHRVDTADSLQKTKKNVVIKTAETTTTESGN